MVYLYGIHACNSALLNPRRVIENVWCSENIAKKLKEERIFEKAPFFLKHKYSIVDKKKLDTLISPGVVHQGIVMKAQPLQTDPIEILKEGPSSQIVIVLDQVTDPQNIGSILRLCRVFNVRALIMTHVHAPQETGAMAKVASGALEVVSRCLVPNLSKALRILKSWGFWCVGLAEDAVQSLREIDLNGKIVLIMGSEGKGMRKFTKDLCDFKAFIPTSSQFSTLNVTSATAISLYEVYVSQNKKG